MPDYGRIAEPQDIFGSLEVDGQGNFVGLHGGYQPSGTYRLVTRHGMYVGSPLSGYLNCLRLTLTCFHNPRLGLSPFLREKLVEKLRGLESSRRS